MLNAKVQALIDAVWLAEGRKEKESSLLTAMKGVMRALTALMNVTVKQELADPQRHMLNALSVYTQLDVFGQRTV